MSESERSEEALRAQVKEYEASQKLLKESEDRFRALSDASFGGIVIHDKGLILDCNQGLSEMTGFTIKELIGMNGLDLIAPGSLDLVLQNIKSGYTQRYEGEGIRRDGSLYPLAIKGKNVQYQGREVRVIEFRYISQRKHTEDKLRKSESKQRAMLENIVDVIVIIDQNGINRFKSSNVEKLFGWKSDELVGVAIWANIHPDDLQHTQKIFTEMLDKADRPITTECRYRCKDGSYKWIKFTGVNRLHDPNISGILLSYHDIAERKDHEKELLKFEKLESIGGLAHDFNNILAGLYGNLSLAKVKLAKDHPVFRYLEAAEKSMSRATLLTNQLLTFAKGGAPVKESLSLKDLIEEVVHFSLSGSNIKPISTQTDNMWLAKVDQEQVQQVFGNLAINAKQAMPDGGHLRITMQNVDVSTNTVANLDAGPYLQVTVTDEGTGISPEHLSKIFDPYFTTKQTGSGLGLATTYSIVNRHGGHLSVTSEVGKGTTFTLYLPATNGQNLPPTPEIKPSVQRHGTKILVMDDEEMILSMAADMLEEMNFTVDTATDGQQVLERYQQALSSNDPFGLVILDMTIPGGMGGEETAKKILSIDPEASLIVSSGYTADPVMANYTEHGFRGVIAKPYSFTKLSEVVNRVLDAE